MSTMLDVKVTTEIERNLENLGSYTTAANPSSVRTERTSDEQKKSY